MEILDAGVKICSTCRLPKPRSDFHRNKRMTDGLANECKTCRHERVVSPERRAYQREIDQHRYDDKPAGARNEYLRDHYADNPAVFRGRRDRYIAGLKAKVFEHYGTKCACCGAGDRLTIDHIEGNGAEHRTELFGRPEGNLDGFYRWLIKEGFPEGYQTLCKRCNASKARNGECALHVTCPCGCGHRFALQKISRTRNR